MGLIQKMLEAGVGHRIRRFRQRIACFGVSTPASVPQVAGVETHAAEDGMVDFTQPASIIRITLDIDIADSDMQESDEIQLEILRGRLRCALDAKLASLTGCWEDTP